MLLMLAIGPLLVLSIPLQRVKPCSFYGVTQPKEFSEDLDEKNDIISIVHNGSTTELRGTPTLPEGGR
jgi:hypothetical protein